MYSESLDMHAASPLHQCLSLEGLDRFLLCGRVWGCVCLFLVWPCPFLGLVIKELAAKRSRWVEAPSVALCGITSCGSLYDYVDSRLGFAETPVRRDPAHVARKKHAMPDAVGHVYMYQHPAWEKFIRESGAEVVTSDQCPDAPVPKMV